MQRRNTFAATTSSSTGRSCARQRPHTTPEEAVIVLVKLAFCGALEGIDSHRELLRVAPTRLDLRRFLAYGFWERLPVHQTISHTHPRRFVDAALFERRIGLSDRP